MSSLFAPKALAPLAAHSRRRGFTLIELLVVIAIISVLAAILLPVFAQVREKGRQTTCVSNEKQLAYGVLMYLQDYDETLLPTAVLQPGDPNGLLPPILWPDEIAPYVKNTQVRLCPSDSKEPAAYPNSYGLNELNFADRTDPGAPAPETLAAFQTTGETVMLGELGTGSLTNPSDIATPIAGAYKLTVPDVALNDQFDARPAARHFQRANLAFMDGHVKSLRMEQFYTGQTPPDKWFCTDPGTLSACVGN